MTRLNCILLCVTLVIGVSNIARTAQAENAYDRLLPLNWEKMKNCELVVAAHYESHITGDTSRDDPEVKSGLIRVQQQTLILHVDRVLKGPNVKAGDLINVELRHWYSIETHPTDDNWRQRAKDDGIPRLCYQYQPGSLSLLQPRQIVPDVRQEMLYFLPSATSPDLERIGQIQSLDLENDWTLALHGYKASLPLRLSQATGDKIYESALDELNATRDPATLNLLFDWLSMPYDRNGLARSAQKTLVAIGDHNGDVYNRAHKRFLEAPSNWIPYNKLTPAEQTQYSRDQYNNGAGQGGSQRRYETYAFIMARVDGNRAAHDFERLNSQKLPFISGVALSQLDATNSDYALDFAFRLLKDPQTVQIGAETIRNMLIPGYQSDFDDSNRISRTEHLKSLAIPRLKESLLLPTFDISRTPTAYASNAPFELSYLRSLREQLEGFLPRPDPAPVDLAHAEQVLLQTKIDEKAFFTSPFEKDWTPHEREGTATLAAIAIERNPRFIPLIVTLMQGVSPWLKTQEGYHAISDYSQMFPHAFKSEMDRQGITAHFVETSLREGFPIGLGRLLNRPNAVWSLRKSDSFGFGRRSLDADYSFLSQQYQSSPARLRVLTDFVAYTLAQDYMSVDLDSLHILSLADPVAARPFIAQALAKVKGVSRSRAPFIVLLIADGHDELVDELLGDYPLSDYKLSSVNTVRDDWPDPRILLWANNPRTFEHYLQIVDVMLNNPTEGTPYWFSFNDFSEYSSPYQMTQALFAHHPREFFDRVLRLLHSSMPFQRTMGTSLLENALYWNAGFNPNALTRERTEKLKTIAPLIEHLASLYEEPMRVALLQHFGIALPKKSQKRQTALRQLLSNSNPTVAHNALRLLELQTGDYYVDFLRYHPVAQRERLWNAMVADHALAEKDTPPPLRVGL